MPEILFERGDAASSTDDDLATVYITPDGVAVDKRIVVYLTLLLRAAEARRLQSSLALVSSFIASHVTAVVILFRESRAGDEHESIIICAKGHICAVGCDAVLINAHIHAANRITSASPACGCVTLQRRLVLDGACEATCVLTTDASHRTNGAAGGCVARRGLALLSCEPD